MKSAMCSGLPKLALVAVFAAAVAGGDTARAQESQPKPAANADEPAKPAAQNPADQDTAIRALLEEVAKLRAQVAEMQKALKPQAAQTPVPAATPAASATPAPAKSSLVEKLDPNDPAAVAARTPPPAPQPAPKADQPAPVARDTQTVVERDVPAYYEGDVPVYVDRTVYVERDPTYVGPAISCCDPWPVCVTTIPWGGSWSCGHWRTSFGDVCRTAPAFVTPAFVTTGRRDGGWNRSFGVARFGGERFGRSVSTAFTSSHAAHGRRR